MYTLHRLIGITLLLISQARPLAALPLAMNATAANAVSPIAPYTMTFDTHSRDGVTVVTPPAPDFDSEVLAPLRTKQAQAQADARRRQVAQRRVVAPAKVVATPIVSAGSSDDLLAKLSLCEAGGIYTRNSGNGYYGAYQYNIGSWANYGGYARADLAPAAVQDAKMRADIATRGWSPWPSCARRIGAI